jgi:hypothetical protein
MLTAFYQMPRHIARVKSQTRYELPKQFGLTAFSFLCYNQQRYDMEERVYADTPALSVPLLLSCGSVHSRQR